MDTSPTVLVHYYYVGPTIALPLLCRPALAPPLTQWPEAFTEHGVTTWPRTTTDPAEVTCPCCCVLRDYVLPPDFREQLFALVHRWVSDEDLRAETRQTLQILMHDLMHDWHAAYPGLTATSPRPPARLSPLDTAGGYGLPDID